jgi:hypothetical protein
MLKIDFTDELSQLKALITRDQIENRGVFRGITRNLSLAHARLYH